MPVIDFLDDHQGAAIAILTAVLIVINAIYAWQNRQMAVEAAKTRELTVLPKLALEFLFLGPTALDVAIKNVGPGPALAIDVRLVFEPSAKNADREERRWRHNLLAPGEMKDFMPPGELNNNLNTLPQNYRSVRLVGWMKDALGKEHPVREELTGLSEWRELLTSARGRYVERPEKELAKALEQKFKQPLGDLNRTLGQIARAQNTANPPPPPPGFDDEEG